MKIENLNNNEGEFFQIKGRNKIFSNNKRSIATVGVDDLIIIDTKDATLITKENNGNNLKTLLQKIKKEKSELLNSHTFELRPWGRFDILFESDLFKVKILEIYPYKRISLQYHNKRSEHWIVISGEALVHLDGAEVKLKEGKSIDIPKQSKHFIANSNKNKLIVVEVMMGEYFGEDDIIRLNDLYE